MHQSDKDWWKNAVIYQIYPRSFLDSNKDGIGDIKGIISKIDYLKSLEFDAIWLSPIFKSPMNDMGYDVSDYFDIDPLFGNMDDFEELINICHENENNDQNTSLQTRCSLLIKTKKQKQKNKTKQNKTKQNRKKR